MKNTPQVPKKTAGTPRRFLRYFPKVKEMAEFLQLPKKLLTSIAVSFMCYLFIILYLDWTRAMCMTDYSNSKKKYFRIKYLAQYAFFLLLFLMVLLLLCLVYDYSEF